MLDITTASYEDLKHHRDECDHRIRELEREMVLHLEEQAARFGLSLTQSEPKQRRKRRTREEIEADEARDI